MTPVRVALCAAFLASLTGCDTFFSVRGRVEPDSVTARLELEKTGFRAEQRTFTTSPVTEQNVCLAPE